MDGQVELVVALVLDAQVVAFDPVHGELRQPEVLANTEVDVNDEVAGIEVLEVGDELVGGGASALSALHALPEDLLLRQQRKVGAWQDEAAGDFAENEPCVHRTVAKGREILLLGLARRTRVDETGKVE